MRDVTPETIVRKRMLIDEIERLLAQPRPRDDSWARALRNAVDELDSIEKDFAPDYDRAQFVPTRDTYIRDVRARFPDLWSYVNLRPRPTAGALKTATPRCLAITGSLLEADQSHSAPSPNACDEVAPLLGCEPGRLLYVDERQLSTGRAVRAGTRPPSAVADS
jgi:hypothetical protein